MSKDRQRRHAAKKEAAVRGDRRVGSDCPVIVVGIGAPAGRVKSLKQLFAKMPPGHGVAFVLIQHLEPSRRNLTVKLVKEQMALAVVEATDGMPVLADRIHVIPPDKFLNITGSRLTLQKAVYCDGLRMPIDHFFCSLAFDQRRRGCGILLSGTGSDGTLGLSEIKAAGGRTFVEDPGSAKLPGMPQGAADAGVVDAVLPVEAMVEAVVALAEQMRAETQSEPGESPEFDANLGAILEILRAKVGHDFRCYKPNTLVRRIRRRMTLGRIATFAGYAGFLREHPEEVALLQKDLLIGVTEFFRQPQAWEILEEKVVAPLVEDAQPGSEIRVWIPGCSTGREAYSLAMLFSEQVEKSGKKMNVQIFATDSDVAALATARSGIYSKEGIGETISPERLKRFFARRDGLYQVIKTIRGQVVFAPQNLTADPPFSRLDLISCRNVLIYLEQQVQKKIITLFHFALREGGFLFLGNAETVGDREDLFVPVSKKWRIYRRIGVGRPVGVEIPVRPTGEPLPAIGKLPAPASTPRMSLASMAQQMLLDRFVPASVMIDRKLQVVYVHGAVEEYLTFPAGELTTRVVDMAREGLRARLRGAIGKCLEINRPVSVTARVRRGDKSVPVKTTVSPLRYPREADGLLLITFDDYRVSAAKSQRPGASGQSEVHQLEDELKITRQELQSTIEQLEASNDQLKASNEEVTASNEELQSANEEMETSKEELQSLNEELNTINSRLHEKVEELEGVNNDVVNLLSSTNIATVFLDKELKVRRYTPASTNLFSLIPSDAGRPIGDVLRRFSDATLLDDARRVLADLSPLSKEVQAEDGRWYIRRITPYRTQDDRIEGVVITFVDVCDLKETEEALRRQHAELEAARTEVENARRRLSVIVDSIADGFFAFDREWRITHLNDAALRHYRKTREEMVGRSLFEVFPPVRGSIFETEYRRAMESGEPVHFEAPSTISDRIMEIHAYPGPDNMTVLFRDVTERNRMVAALRESHEHAAWLARFPEENPSPVARVSAEGSVLYRNPAAAELPGWACEVGQSLPDPLLPMVGKAMKEEGEVQQDVELGGSSYSVSVSALPGERYANVYGRDTTERKRAEEELKEATRLVQQHAAQLEAIFETMTDPLLFYDAQGRPQKINTAAAALLGIDRNVNDLDEPALMAIWKSKNYRDLDGRPMSREEMPFRRALNGETVRGQVLCLTAAGGREAILEVNAAVLESNGRRDGVVVVWHDITERKQAEEALRRYELLSAHTRDIILFMQRDNGQILEANAAATDAYGYSRDELLTMKIQDLRPPDTRGLTAVQMAEADTKGILFETLHQRKDGSTFPVEVSSRGATVGDTRTLISVIRNITERKVRENRIARLTKLYAVLSQVNEAIVRTHDEERLYGEVCRIVAEEGGFPLVWVGRVKGRQVAPAASFGPAAAYLKEIRVETEGELGSGPTGTSIREDRPVINDDFDINPSTSPWRKPALRFGFRASAAFPLHRQGGVVGVFTLYAAEPGAFDQEQVNLLEALCADISYALDAMHQETLRTKTEQALRENERRLAELVERSPSFVCVLRGPDHVFELANEKYFQVVGRRDILGKKLLEALPEISATPYPGILDRVYRTGEPFSASDVSLMLARGSDGQLEQIWLDFIYLPLREQDGSVSGIFVHGVNITERKNAEQALRESAQRLNRAQEIAHLGSWELDLADNRLTWSDEAYRIFGLQPQEFGATYEAFLEVVHPDDRATVDAAYSGSVREGRDTYEIEHRVTRKPTGEIRIVHERYEHIRDESGQIIRSIGMVHDITDRKRAEEALRQRTLELQQLTQTLEQRVQERTAELAKSNAMLQAEMAERLRLVAAVEQAGEGITIMDREGVIDYVNPAFEGISGLGRPKLLGKSYYDLPVKERTDPDIRKKIQDAIRAGEAWSGHVNRRRRDGQSFELNVTFSPIRDQSAKVTNYLAVEQDVTQEVRLEQHLRQMQKMEAIGTLAGGIAHDFNNLLNPIFINTELVLLDAPLDDRMRQYLQMVLQAAERGRNLVKQIITFSRQKEGERKPTKAEPLIKEVLKFLRSTLPQTVEIRQNIQRETAFILADPTQIHQVIMNLCSNAAYAMRERGGVLEVNLAEVEVDPDMALRYPDFKPGPYLRLTVTDTGAGMTREVMERAFDPFFTTKKPGEGSGMGLSVVHGIVRNHGGAITVYSEAGKGSTFNIFFPRLEAEGSPLDVPLAPLAAGRERILLVDDEEAQVESVRNMLERMGYKVVAKTDSGEALALFRQNPRLFDLVVTDQTMPQMTGVKLAEELLRIRPDLPVILCTGFSETVDAKAAQASGIRHFLMKPFSVREMAETIRRALEKK